MSMYAIFVGGPMDKQKLVVDGPTFRVARPAVDLTGWTKWEATDDAVIPFHEGEYRAMPWTHDSGARMYCWYGESPPIEYCGICDVEGHSADIPHQGYES